MQVTSRVKFLLKTTFVLAVAAISFNLGNYSATEGAKATIERLMFSTPTQAPQCKGHGGEFILPRPDPKQKYNI